MRMDNVTNTTDWLTQTLQSALQAGLPYIDVLFDLARTGSRPFSTPPHLVLAQQKLLQGTAHEAAVDEGPALVRYRIEQASDCSVLATQLASRDAQHAMMLLQSRQPFLSLAAQLQYFALASWNKGIQHGILRFYNRFLFMPVLDALTETDRLALLSAASRWHWRDRDGKPRHALATEAALAWQMPATSLLLGEETVQRLNCWHESELYVQHHLLTPDQAQCASREAMMQKVFHAQMAAELAGLFDQNERDAFITRQL